MKLERQNFNSRPFWIKIYLKIEIDEFRIDVVVQVNGASALEALKSLYHSAGVLRHWRAVRYCSSLLNHTVDSISPFITTVLVNGKQVGYTPCALLCS